MLEINKPQSPAVRSAIERLRSRMNVGRAIVAQRMKLGLSQDEIARRAGTKQSRISELETLGGNVRFDTLDKVAWALDLEVTLAPRFHAVTIVAAGDWFECTHEIAGVDAGVAAPPFPNERARPSATGEYEVVTSVPISPRQVHTLLGSVS